jgi:dihydropyrimidinase
MQLFDLILRNACINGSYVSDIGIKHGVISAIGLNLSATEDTQIIDCDGAVVTPGGIDGHVHLSQDRSPRARAAGYVSADTSKLSDITV